VGSRGQWTYEQTVNTHVVCQSQHKYVEVVDVWSHGLTQALHRLTLW